MKGLCGRFEPVMNDTHLKDAGEKDTKLGNTGSYWRPSSPICILANHGVCIGIHIQEREQLSMNEVFPFLPDGLPAIYFEANMSRRRRRYVFCFPPLPPLRYSSLDR